MVAANESSELTQIRDLLESLMRILVYREIEADFQRNSKLKELFDLTGQKSHTEIQKQLHISPNDITAQWVAWRKRGLIQKVGNGYRKLWRE